MTKFGEALRSFRQASNDPDRFNRRLSQQRLGELIGHEMRDWGFSGAAVSDWERGESKISAEDRNVLIALIQVLHRCGGLQTFVEANQFLESGNYRALDPDEARKIFKSFPYQSSFEQSGPKAKITKSTIPFLLENLFAISEEELQIMVTKAKEGPAPSWPRILAAFMRSASDPFSISITTIAWIWVWLFAWWLISPSLRWPFSNTEEAERAIGMYIGASLAVPLLIGLLINTKDNEYWIGRSLTDSFLVRLYTYQGAGIGFNLGYFLVFPFSLARYYLHLESSIWLELAAVTAALILGNMSARLVPYNLWLAYGRLKLSDGAIFFVGALLGPIWGWFFLESYSVLLTPVLGTLAILLSMTMMVIITMWQSKRQA